jgi:hypothetical protein
LSPRQYDNGQRTRAYRTTSRWSSAIHGDDQMVGSVRSSHQAHANLKTLSGTLPITPSNHKTMKSQLAAIGSVLELVGHL